MNLIPNRFSLSIAIRAYAFQPRSWYAQLIKWLLVALASLMGLTSASAQSEGRLLNLNADGVILDGYDPVAFFTDNKPVKGSAAYQTKHEGAIYYFASAEHQQLFEANPRKYEPQFGAFCAYAVSLGRTAPIDVNTFSIVNERLVVQHNQKAVNGWNKDVPGNLALADQYWPAVVKNHGKQIRTNEEAKYLENVNQEGVILDGYDPVGYFTDNKAIKGSADYQSRYEGATYYFTSAEHKQLFDDNPAKYQPQYGGYCAYAVSLNKLRPVDVNIFQFVDGRLLLQHTQDAYDQFNKDTQGNTKKADQNWPLLVKKRAGKQKGFDAPAKS